MTLIEEPPRTEWDVSAFVNYQTEELTTPTEKELTEELPEWEGRAEMERKIEEKESRPRRGVGFLRAETIEDLPESDSTDSSFGEGLFEAEPGADEEETDQSPKRSRRRGGRGRGRDRTGDSNSAGESAELPPDDRAESDETSAKPGRKRRRRRNRKSRRNVDKSDASLSVDSAEPRESVQTSAESEAVAEVVAASQTDGAPADPVGDGEPKKKRRRRRRRNRKKNGSEGSAGDAGPAGETPGGDNVQP